MQPRHMAWSWAGSAGGSLTRRSSGPYRVFGGEQLRRRILTQLLLLWACVLECWAPQICCATEHTRARHRPTRTNTYFSTVWAHGLWERWLSPSPSPAPQPLGRWKDRRARWEGHRLSGCGHHELCVRRRLMRWTVEAAAALHAERCPT